jgi:hypothetical protein
MAKNSDKSVDDRTMPRAGFTHKVLTNGLTVSRCNFCSALIASPTPSSLQMAEENHACEVMLLKQKRKKTA